MLVLEQITACVMVPPVWLSEALLAHAAVEGQHKALRRTLQLLAALPASHRYILGSRVYVWLGAYSDPIKQCGLVEWL